MNLLTRFTQEQLPLTRIEAFSDGVFAIIVTLLVLELKVPSLQDPRSASALGYQLLALVPQFLSWLISFVIVCKFWLKHHHILGLARHADYAMVWPNSLFLMGHAFIPCPIAPEIRRRLDALKQEMPVVPPSVHDRIKARYRDPAIVVSVLRVSGSSAGRA